MEGLVINPKGWKLRNYIAFIKAANTQDFDAMFLGMSKIVEKWPFKGDPKNPEDYNDIELEDWMSLSKAVGEALSDKFTRGN